MSSKTNYFFETKLIKKHLTRMLKEELLTYRVWRFNWLVLWSWPIRTLFDRAKRKTNS